MLHQPKSRNVAAILAFISIFTPIAGFHKFYLGQPVWGIVYVLLSWTPIPQLASVIEGVWYLAQAQADFDYNFNSDLPLANKSLANPSQVNGVAQTLHQLDTLRQEGLISESEFEQKRRQLLNSKPEITVAPIREIDVNQASLDDWLKLPGISIHQARFLVELRQAGVRFYSLEELAVALNVSLQQLKPLEPVLKFLYYEEGISPTQFNPNTATVETLLQIPLMEPDLANAIVQKRQESGSYRNLADFQQRLSLSGELVSKLMHYLRF